VTFFEDSRHSEPEAPLAPDVVAYYRRVLHSHSDDPDTGVCPVCQVARCADRRDAFDKLALAGEVMAGPEQRVQRSREHHDVSRPGSAGPYRGGR
jgi:hypothetical protein